MTHSVVLVSGYIWISYIWKYIYIYISILYLNRSLLVICFMYCCCCCSGAQSSPSLCDPTDCSTPGFPVLHHLPELAQTRVHWVMMPSNHLVLCHPLLLLNQFSSVQLFSHVWLFETPWTAASQASLSITNSWSLLKLMSIESVMSSNHLILKSPSPPAVNLSQHQGLFQWVSSSH